MTQLFLNIVPHCGSVESSEVKAGVFFVHRVNESVLRLKQWLFARKVNRERESRESPRPSVRAAFRRLLNAFRNTNMNLRALCCREPKGPQSHSRVCTCRIVCRYAIR